MNLLYLTQFYSSNRAGGPLIFYDLARTMASRGHMIHIICNLSTEDVYESNIAMHMVKPYLKGSNLLPPSMVQNLRYIVNCIIHGIKIIKEHKIDVIHANSFTPIIAGSTLGRLTNVPVVSAVLDVFTGNEFGGWDRWAKFNKLPKYYAIIGRLLEKCSLIMPSDLIHTISKTTMKDILKIQPRAKVKVIYPGIDASVSTINMEREYNDFILFIGRLVYYKNVDILLKAWPYVIQVVPNAQLIIVGDGPMKETWKKAASNSNIDKNVSFLGNVSTDKKVELLSKCSALALPSLFEGFGLVILEAFAKGKPVLVSDVKPFDEIVDNGKDGFIIPSEDHIQWSQKMKYLLLNKPVSKSMGESGLPKALDKFSFKKSMDQMELLYKGVIQAHKHVGESGDVNFNNNNN